MILDNSPIAYALHRDNAIPISDWLANNFEDEALLDLLPFLNGLRPVRDVRSILTLKNHWDFSISYEISYEIFMRKMWSSTMQKSSQKV